jgi:hypothetical protein
LLRISDPIGVRERGKDRKFNAIGAARDATPLAPPRATICHRVISQVAHLPARGVKCGQTSPLPCPEGGNRIVHAHDDARRLWIERHPIAGRLFGRRLGHKIKACERRDVPYFTVQMQSR